IEYSADHITTDHYIGSGRVNLFKALSLNANPTLYATIKSPDHNTTVSGTIAITGTALGDSYVLEYQPSGSSTWTQFASGSQTINGTLGTLDTSLFSVGTAFQVRLTATKGTSTDTDTISLYQLGPSGWRQSTGSNNTHSAVVYADLDGDGHQEVIVGADYTLNVWRSDGTPFPGFPVDGSAVLDMTTPAVGDIDGDGVPDI